MQFRTNQSLLIAAASIVLAAGAAPGIAGTQAIRLVPEAALKAVPGAHGFRLVASDTSADDYRKRMGAQIDEWKQKVDDFSTEAKEKGTAASKSAARKLDRAWDNVKTQWGKLQNATDDSWDDTKAAFDKAWRDFQDTWKSTTSRS